MIARPAGVAILSAIALSYFLVWVEPILTGSVPMIKHEALALGGGPSHAAPQPPPNLTSTHTSSQALISSSSPHEALDAADSHALLLSQEESSQSSRLPLLMASGRPRPHAMETAVKLNLPEPRTHDAALRQAPSSEAPGSLPSLMGVAMLAVAIATLFATISWARRCGRFAKAVDLDHARFSSTPDLRPPIARPISLAAPLIGCLFLGAASETVLICWTCARPSPMGFIARGVDSTNEAAVAPLGAWSLSGGTTSSMLWLLASPPEGDSSSTLCPTPVLRASDRPWWSHGAQPSEYQVGPEQDIVLRSAGWPFPAASGAVVRQRPAGGSEILTVVRGVSVQACSSYLGDLGVSRSWLPNPSTNLDILPTNPIWPGLLADSCVLGGIWALLLVGIPQARRLVRVARVTRFASQGRCSSCGYCIAGVDRPLCPECGSRIRIVRLLLASRSPSPDRSGTTKAQRRWSARSAQLPSRPSPLS